MYSGGCGGHGGRTLPINSAAIAAVATAVAAAVAATGSLSKN